MVDESWPWVWEADDLAAYYRHFVAYIQGCEPSRCWVQEQVAESYRLLEWMRTSARQDVVLNRKQLK